MLQKLRKQAEGFTIIEVLIVLAIAGLILLIVFLAVPALQRNSRNTNRRNDVSKMLGALQEATNNNNGALPTGATAPSVVTDKLGFYQAADVNYNVTTTGGATVPGTVDGKTVILRNGYKCGSATPTGSPASTAGVTSTAGASARNAVAVFAVEISGGQLQAQCVES